MTDREKIVELLEQLDAVSYEKSKTETGFMIIKRGKEYIADYLISHGVTVKELQKPLTVEEIEPEIVCWHEERNNALFPVEIGRIASFIQLYIIGGDCPIEEKEWEYGKTWRCWAEKPTDAEREAAEWMK